MALGISFIPPNQQQQDQEKQQPPDEAGHDQGEGIDS